MLRAGGFFERMAETFIVGEIVKSYANCGVPAGFCHYRDAGMRRADLMVLSGGRPAIVRCGVREEYGPADVRPFEKLRGALPEAGPSCIVCFCERPYPLGGGVCALPVSSIRAGCPWQ